MEELIKIKQMLAKAGTPVPVFLNWVADRLVMVYNEPENIDFIHALRDRAKQLEEIAKLLAEHRSV